MTATATADPGTAPDSLATLDAGGIGWRQWLSAGLSLALLVVILRQLDHNGLDKAADLLPARPGFWIALIALYFALPLSELFIFRRLWNLPWAGFGALLRKRLSNELLLGYSGELYFYLWARRHARLPAAPFGAIKDVSILSALVGNAFTLAMLLALAPLIGRAELGLASRPVLWSAAVLVAISLAVIVWSRRIFTLSRPELAMVLAVQVARTLATTLLLALVWHLALPTVPLFWWLLLSTLRMLVSRLPFVPNKDLLFAAAATFLVGHDGELATLMALTATLILALHLLTGSALLASGLTSERNR